MQQSSIHIPVLLDTVLRTLDPRPGDAILDVTLGLGGHSAAFLAITAPDGVLVGLDADECNLRAASNRLHVFKDRITLHHLNFGEMQKVVLPMFDIIFADLGLSSPHIDDPARGFTFRKSAPFDLRFDQSSGMAASQLVRQSNVFALKTIFREYGELFHEAHRLATLIAGQSFAMTTDLSSAVEKAFGFRAKRILPQVFQALRIAVNDELTMLDHFLSYAPLLLKSGGRIGIISFHSLEDRRVKQAFRTLSRSVKDSVSGQVSIAAPFEEISRKPLIASAKECADNPRARSAKFRALRRLPF